MSRPGAGKKPGTRLKVRVKTGKGRTVSQKAWLERQLNDPYVAEARKQGFRSRAAFKLIEIDDKYKFLKPGGRIVDLGAAPGGWSQVAAKRVKAEEGRGRVIAIASIVILLFLALRRAVRPCAYTRRMGNDVAVTLSPLWFLAGEVRTSQSGSIHRSMFRDVRPNIER